MGYTTEFFGHFELDRPLAPEHKAYLTAFSNTRRMKRSSNAASEMDDPVREAAGLPIGEFGEHFVGGKGEWGMDEDVSVLDGNEPPPSQPGLWCDWAPTKDGKGIGWNGREKFYDYVEWLEYIVEHFLRPWGYTLSGAVRYQGERWDDEGTIRVEDDRVALS